MKRATILILLIVIMGCSAETSNSVPVHYQETIGNFAYEIKVNKNEFTLNDKIKVYAKIKNIGNETLSYNSGNSSCPVPLWIGIVNQESNKSLNLATKTHSSCTTDLHISHLEPNQSVEAELEFKPKYGKKRAPRGIYDVKITLPSPSIFLVKDKEYPSAKTSISIK
ncbi:hypothetical protein [Paenibacillus glycanilyticus]|uniref:Intracellular proteinase inhibitor BsuPI domain-containing protein n=1 Tax=Paenibacillus glycanilyticus TaxID=126569 RepID=A0ABQ6G7T7_9BACL|nr:hypothetical protein [Paenibacillus glycanilyticus]GLX66323.1 hypothetical protein MU1_06670 [Paenibacillus glycanilyticus]